MLHGAQHLAWALELMHPRVILFLDEPAADASHLTVTHHPHQIRDPFRAGQMYEGWWGESDDESHTVHGSSATPAAPKSTITRFRTRVSEGLKARLHCRK